MTPEQFVYWLQGHMEIRGTDEPLSAEQVKVIREHLAKVLTHVPSAEYVRPSGQTFKLDPFFLQPGLIC